MAAKSKKSSAKTTPARKETAKAERGGQKAAASASATKKRSAARESDASEKGIEVRQPLDREERSFVRGVVIRGEAAEPSEDGALPSGATHEIVEDGDGVLPTLQRKRFSAF